MKERDSIQQRQLILVVFKRNSHLTLKTGKFLNHEAASCLQAYSQPEDSHNRLLRLTNKQTRHLHRRGSREAFYSSQRARREAERGRKMRLHPHSRMSHANVVASSRPSSRTAVPKSLPKRAKRRLRQQLSPSLSVSNEPRIAGNLFFPASKSRSFQPGSKENPR